MSRVSITRHAGRAGWVELPDPRRPRKSERADTYLRLLLHGDRGQIAWGWHTAAEIASWRVAKNDKGEWTLTATATRVDPFYLRQTQPSLLFTAPKVHGPPWCWPVQEITYQGLSLRARLGPVEF